MSPTKSSDLSVGAPSKPSPAAWPALAAIGGFFSLLPAAGASGALALPLLLSLAGLASLRPSALRRAAAAPSLPIILLVLLNFWICLSALWSPHDDHTLVLKLVALILLGLVFVQAAGAGAAARLTSAGGLAAFAVLAALLCIEALFGLPLNRLAQPDEPLLEVSRNAMRGATVIVALSWAVAAAALAKRRAKWTAVGFAVLASGGFLSLQFDQLANAVAFGAGLVVFLIAFLAPRGAILLTSSVLAAWLLTAPFLLPALASNQRWIDQLPFSLAARAEIWRYISARVAEQPWVGHGLEASRAVTDIVTLRGYEMSAVPVHPHSASLQIWFETGLVGALLAGAMLVTGGVALSRRFGSNRAAAAAAAATLASLGIIANVSFSLWAEWWIATMFVAAALITAIPRTGASRP